MYDIPGCLAGSRLAIFSCTGEPTNEPNLYDKEQLAFDKCTMFDVCASKVALKAIKLHERSFIEGFVYLSMSIYVCVYVRLFENSLKKIQQSYMLSIKYFFKTNISELHCIFFTSNNILSKSIFLMFTPEMDSDRSDFETTRRSRSFPCRSLLLQCAENSQ